MTEKRYILKSEAQKTPAQRILEGSVGVLTIEARSATVTAAMVELKNNKNLPDEERQKLMEYVKKWRGQVGLRNIGGISEELID